MKSTHHHDDDKPGWLIYKNINSGKHWVFVNVENVMIRQEEFRKTGNLLITFKTAPQCVLFVNSLSEIKIHMGVSTLQNFYVFANDEYVIGWNSDEQIEVQHITS